MVWNTSLHPFSSSHANLRHKIYWFCLVSENARFAQRACNYHAEANRSNFFSACVESLFETQNLCTNKQIFLKAYSILVKENTFIFNPVLYERLKPTPRIGASIYCDNALKALVVSHTGLRSLDVVLPTYLKDVGKCQIPLERLTDVKVRIKFISKFSSSHRCIHTSKKISVHTRKSWRNQWSAAESIERVEIRAKGSFVNACEVVRSDEISWKHTSNLHMLVNFKNIILHELFFLHQHSSHQPRPLCSDNTQSV
jgi:hypothetical protein